MELGGSQTGFFFLRVDVSQVAGKTHLMVKSGRIKR